MSKKAITIVSIVVVIIVIVIGIGISIAKATGVTKVVVVVPPVNAVEFAHVNVANAVLLERVRYVPVKPADVAVRGVVVRGATADYSSVS